MARADARGVRPARGGGIGRAVSTRAPSRAGAEAIVPMINVVFLLLIFFLMTARIAPAPPFDLDLPRAEDGTRSASDRVLYLSRDGMPALDGITGEAVWAVLAAGPADASLALRADAGMPAAALAPVLARLSAMGIDRVALSVRAR